MSEDLNQPDEMPHVPTETKYLTPDIKDKCVWSEDINGIWFSKCGEVHEFVEGTPKSNSHKYCPYCGKPIEEKPYKEEEK